MLLSYSKCVKWGSTLIKTSYFLKITCNSYLIFWQNRYFYTILWKVKETLGSWNIVFLPFKKEFHFDINFPRDNYKDTKLGTGNGFPFFQERTRTFWWWSKAVSSFLRISSLSWLSTFLRGCYRTCDPGTATLSAPPAAGPCLLLALGSWEQHKNYFLSISKERKLLFCHLRQECCQKAGILGVAA